MHIALLSDLFDNLQTIDMWHVYIDEVEIEPGFFYGIYSSLTIGKCSDCVADSLEKFFDRVVE